MMSVSRRTSRPRAPGTGGRGLWAVGTFTAVVGIVGSDIVVVMDNSGSMAQEQAAFSLSFQTLLGALTNPPDADGDGRPDYVAVEDINLAVTSTDMGTMGYSVNTCLDYENGDDGCFLYEPSPLVSGCAPSFPPFLSWSHATGDVGQLAEDFTCLSTLGTSGCGFERHLDAMRKAVTTNAQAGGCNQGFLRAGSLLVLLWVTDENDSSVLPSYPEMFDQERSDLGHLNVRPFLHPEFLTPVAEFVDAFRSTGHEVIVGMIVGTPPDEAACEGSGDTLGGCLDVPAMQEQIDPAFAQSLIPSCNTSMGIAFPPRRLVELAQAFATRSYVDSVCKEDWTATMAGIGRTVAASLPAGCLNLEMEFDATLCRANCALIETLNDDRPCPDDPECPAAGCPSLTWNDLARQPIVADVPACTHPESGEPCQPAKRDFGVATDRYGGSRQRQCLVRQSRREPDAGGGCATPSETGWFYSPDEAGMRIPNCPRLMFQPDAGHVIEMGSVANLLCANATCPDERQCGPVDDPDYTCCRRDEVCVPDVDGGEGTCL
jgi:hypothetical protein